MTNNQKQHQMRREKNNVSSGTNMGHCQGINKPSDSIELGRGQAMEGRQREREKPEEDR
jgi:hypothetical protein